MNQFSFHPGAEADLIEIWDFIAADSVDAADRVRDNIVAAIQALVRIPNQYTISGGPCHTAFVPCGDPAPSVRRS